MGPRSEDRGLCIRLCRIMQQGRASMGPRSEDRGLCVVCKHKGAVMTRFNGSTVRGPWSVTSEARVSDHDPDALQWVHGPRTVVCCIPTDALPGTPELQWVHGPRTVVCR